MRANFVERSVVDPDEIERGAAQAKHHRDVMAKTGSYENAWRIYHDSFADNEDEVCKALFDGFKNSFEVLGRRNLDEVTSTLRALGRDDAADTLIKFADENGSKEFWTADDPFNREPKDPLIRTIADRWTATTKPIFNLEADLIRATTNPRDDLLTELAAVPVEEYQSLFNFRR